MKRTFKQLIAILIVAVMAFGLIPNLITAGTAVKAAVDNEVVPAPNGYIHTEMHGARAVSTAYERGDMETYYRLTGATRDTLPSSYDSRNYNYITSVKDQNPYGSCWAHAAMGSIEAYMIKEGVPVGTGSAATTSLNLSETQHCFFNYSSAYDAENMLTGDKATLTGSDGCLDSGGNGEMSAYTLQRWCGAADESQSALQYSKASTVASSGLGSQYSYQYNVCHVQNSEWIPGTDIEGIKRAIMNYGAGNISYCASSGYTTYTNTYQCVIDNSSQESSSHKWANHAITVVGWDDSISKSNFRPNQPSGNGAWLCKNSWGTSYFNQGYMWISYEDTSVGEGYLYFYDAEPIDNYDHNYQYDGTCNPVPYGSGNRTGFANDTKVANVFTAKGSELLRAVALCSWDEALTYTLEIYKNPTTGNPSSGTLMTTQTGTLTYSGYYTIPLDNPVALAAGDTFSVVFTQNVPTADESGKYVHTPYDSTFNDTSLVSWCTWTHVNHGNTSYYKEPNGSWTDCPDNGDYRIKAYTDDVTFTVSAVSNNTSYGTVSVTGNVITANPANGYYVESCDVISGTATCTINGNTIIVSASSDCTIRVNFAPKPTYTINFVASGNAEGTQSALVLDEITLPTSVSVNPVGWTFSGWTTAQLDETTDAPEYYAPGASYTVTGNATLYALYTRTEGSNETVYKLLTAAPANWEGNYVITSGTTNSMYVLKGLSGNTSYESSSAGGTVTFANSGMTLDGDLLKSVGSAYIFTAASADSGYSLRNTSTGTYMGSYNSYLYSRSSYSSSYCIWALEYDSSNACMKVSNSASSNYPYMVKGSNSYFVVNSTYTTNKTQLWKETNLQTVYYNTDPVIAQPTYYTVTFVDGVDGTVLSTQQVIEGGAATAPAVPEHPGYMFLGWDTDFSNVTGDLTVTAEYSIRTYQLAVYYQYENGSIAATAHIQNYNYGAAYSVTSPSITGYTPDQAVVSGIMPAQNTEIIVVYHPNTYTVTFTINGETYQEVDFAYGAAVTAPDYTAPEGHTFSGWTVPETMPAYDITLDATLTVNSYTLTINYVDEEGEPVAEAYTAAIEYGASYSVNSPEIEGYTADVTVVEGVMGAADVTVTVTYTANQPAGLPGDVDLDGTVDINDALLCMRHAMGIITLTDPQALANADYDGKNGIDTTDALQIMRYALMHKGIDLTR